MHTIRLPADWGSVFSFGALCMMHTIRLPAEASCLHAAAMMHTVASVNALRTRSASRPNQRPGPAPALHCPPRRSRLDPAEGRQGQGDSHGRDSDRLTGHLGPGGDAEGGGDGGARREAAEDALLRRRGGE